MNARPYIRILGLGRYLPDRVLTNRELETMVDTSDEWIRTRTGIRERRIAPPDMTAAEMGRRAAEAAMACAGVGPDDIDLLLVSTATPDRLLPATACDLQALLGLRRAGAYDFATACSGFLYGLALAEGHIATGQARHVLLVCTEKMSSIIDWSDRATCVLFGDGAGAAVLGAANGDGRGLLSVYLRADGSLGDLLQRPAGGARCPLTPELLATRAHLVRMEGPEVFKSAVRSMCEASLEALQRAGLERGDVDLLVPHQANIRIIEATARYAGIPMEKVFINIDRYGNMSSASIPVALDEAVESGRVGPGDRVLMVGFGAGFTWGSAVVRL